MSEHRYTPPEAERFMAQKPLLQIDYCDTSLRNMAGREKSATYIPGELNLSPLSIKNDVLLPNIQPLVRPGITLGANLVSSWALEGACGLVGGAMEKINPLSFIDNGTLPEKALLAGIWAASYYAWYRGAKKNAVQTFKALESESMGVSTSFTAKLAHDLVARYTHNENLRKFVTYGGSGVWQIALEIPYYLGAIIEQKFVGSQNAWLSGIVFANLTAAAYNNMQAEGVLKIENLMEKRRKKSNSPNVNADTSSDVDRKD